MKLMFDTKIRRHVTRSGSFCEVFFRRRIAYGCMDQVAGMGNSPYDSLTQSISPDKLA